MLKACGANGVQKSEFDRIPETPAAAAALKT